MTDTRRIAGALALLCVIAATACNKKSPIDPSLLALSSSGTRLLSLSGDIDFGSVPVGSTVTRTLTITNTGTGPVSVTGLTTESGSGTLGLTQNFTPGVIAAGSTKTVAVVFAPAIGQSYGTFVTIQGNHTNGPLTIIVEGTGSVDHIPLFSMSGSGNANFDIPTHVSRIRVTGKFVDTGGSPSLFVVYRNTILEINSDLRTADFDVTGFMTGGGRVQIQNSPAITWSFTEVR